MGIVITVICVKTRRNSTQTDVVLNTTIRISSNIQEYENIVTGSTNARNTTEVDVVPDTTIQTSSYIHEYENTVTGSKNANNDGYQSVGSRNITQSQYAWLKFDSTGKDTCPDYVNLQIPLSLTFFLFMTFHDI